MAEKTSITVRIDKDLKEQSEEIFEALGMNMTTAINVFLRQVVKTNGLPFELTLNQTKERTTYDRIGEFDDLRNLKA